MNDTPKREFPQDIQIRGHAFCSFSLLWTQEQDEFPSGLNFDFLDGADGELPSPLEDYLSVMYNFTLGKAFRNSIVSEYKGSLLLNDNVLRQVRVDVVVTKVRVERLYVFRFDVFCDPFVPGSDGSILTGRLMSDLARFVGVTIDVSNDQKTDTSKTKSDGPSSVHDLLSYIASFAPKRSTAPSFTQTHHVSICSLQEKDYVDRREKLAPFTRALLLAQPELVSSAMAGDFLENRRWSPAEFFELYHQPGATVSISKKFPSAIYEKHNSFFTDSNFSTSADGKDLFEKIVKSSGSAISNSYDALPEYPPLKYLAYSTSFLSALIEEILRFSSEDLIKIRRRHVLSIWSIPGVETRVNRIEMALARLYNLDNLRLPVMREFVDQMTADKRVDNVRVSINDLKSSNLNSTLLFLAIISVIFAVLFGFSSLILGLMALTR